MIGKNQPLVSILVPIYRVEQYIERCARSVFGQTYQNLEFVFVNDASDDNSIIILGRVMEDYPNRLDAIKIIHHIKNKGLAAARNTAVAASQGEFLFHVDSDDWLELNAVELMVQKQLETGADIVSAEAFDWNKGKKTNHLTGGWNLDKKNLLEGILSFRISTTVWRRLIRRSLYVDNSITCDECASEGEDFQVLPRLVYYAQKITGIEKYIYNHNQANNNSYTNIAKHNIEIQLQGLVSVKVVMDFFSDKEQYLKDAVVGLDSKTIHSRMVSNAFYGNKFGYDLFLHYLNKSDSSYWHLFHWDLLLVKYLERNYYFLFAVQSARKFYLRIKDLVKIICL